MNRLNARLAEAHESQRNSVTPELSLHWHASPIAECSNASRNWTWTRKDPKMPKLLVSVRNAHEAGLALDAGVDLIDVKEPSRGALGAASPRHIHEILRLVNGRCLDERGLWRIAEFEWPRYSA